MKKGNISPNVRVVNELTSTLIESRFWDTYQLTPNIPRPIKFSAFTPRLEKHKISRPESQKINFSIIYAQMDKLNITRPTTMHNKTYIHSDEYTAQENNSNFQDIHSQFEGIIFPELVRGFRAATKYSKYVPTEGIVDKKMKRLIYQRFWEAKH